MPLTPHCVNFAGDRLGPDFGFNRQMSSLRTKKLRSLVLKIIAIGRNPQKRSAKLLATHYFHRRPDFCASGYAFVAFLAFHINNKIYLLLTEARDCLIFGTLAVATFKIN